MSKISPLTESSPWYKLYKMAPPNVDWCEASTGGWINEPANTWSNFFYFFLAGWAYKATAKVEDKTLKAFAPAFLFMGLFSFIYHASYNFFAQWLDFIGMFLMTGLFSALNLRRMGVLKRDKLFFFYSAFVLIFGIMVIIFYIKDIPIQIIIAAQALFLMFSEIRLRNKETKYKNFFISVVLILVAVSFSIMDVTGVYCNPNNHLLQGHALWHLFSSISLAFAFKFYAQFDYRKI